MAWGAKSTLYCSPTFSFSTKKGYDQILNTKSAATALTFALLYRLPRVIIIVKYIYQGQKKIFNLLLSLIR